MSRPPKLGVSIYIDPADPKAMRRRLRKSKLALIGVGVAAGMWAKTMLDRLVPDEDDEEDEEGEGPHGQ